ncbi:MAG TPA: C4-type zinc ribbon domain-containing protein [Longimicrobiales bacterium]|nr:C4-type zinc ribbon domain-containing protein [Longimicrobiales bacterium]
MQEVHKALLELQEIDEEIFRAETELATFGPRLAELEAPVTGLEREVTALREQVAAMRQEARRLERAAEQKRDRLRQFEERLQRVRNPREEAAARTEVDLVRRAVDADEDEALQLLDQIKRNELKLDEQEKHLQKTRDEVEPRRQALLAERDESETNLGALRERRHNQEVRLDPAAARLYERARSGKRRRVLAELTRDGACGVCFNVLPIQQQAEVRAGRTLFRCEACGTILYPSD